MRLCRFKLLWKKAKTASRPTKPLKSRSRSIRTSAHTRATAFAACRWCSTETANDGSVRTSPLLTMSPLRSNDAPQGHCSTGRKSEVWYGWSWLESEVRGQRPERSEVRGQKSEVRGSGVTSQLVFRLRTRLFRIRICIFCTRRAVWRDQNSKIVRIVNNLIL